MLTDNGAIAQLLQKLIQLEMYRVLTAETKELRILS